MPFKPRLALDDGQVIRRIFKTRVNPNLLKNKGDAEAAIEEVDPRVAQLYKKQERFVNEQNKIHKVDKTKKKRNHDN